MRIAKSTAACVASTTARRGGVNTSNVPSSLVPPLLIGAYNFAKGIHNHEGIKPARVCLPTEDPEEDDNCTDDEDEDEDEEYVLSE